MKYSLGKAYNGDRKEREEEMPKIAVCDDDKESVIRLKEMILSAGISKEIDCYESGEKLVESDQNYDILFLDIDMDGMNGIETAKILREKDKNVKIIYVTSYAEYVHYAFAVHAFAYLLKPVSQEQIKAQLQEAISYYQKRKKEDEISIRFETKDGSELVRINDIYYFEYRERRVYVKTKKENLIIRGGIREIAERMKGYDFAVPHKSFVVNLFYVKAVKGYDIRMMDGSLIPLSQKKSTEFRSLLNKFLAECI